MVNKLRNSVCVLLALCLVLSVAGGFADAFTVSYTTYDTTYERILKMYLEVINGLGTIDYGRHDLFNPAVYSWIDPMDGYSSIINTTKKYIGYMKYDVNQDGIDELLIGSNGSSINSVFTMDNGKIRELIRAGGYGTASSNYTCSMLANGNFFRWGHGGAGMDYYELWQMNGTGPVTFAGGYHTDSVWDPDSQTGGLIWYRSDAQMSKVTNSASARVESAVAERWIREQEENVFNKKFVPFSVLEKYLDDPWSIAVLSVNKSVSSAAKVNVRKGTDPKSKLVASKKAGTYVKVLAREGEYFKIAFENKEGYIYQDYLTPLTYEIIPDAGIYSASGNENPDQKIVADEQGQYPANGKTNVADVNVRVKTDKKSRLVTTIKKKGTAVVVKGDSVAEDGMVWYEIEYNGKEGFVRSDFINIEEKSEADAVSGGELYGLVIKKLATRSGPSPRAEDTGTYSVKGQRLRIYSRAYDPIENAWWVKCDVPYHGEIRTLWAWYTRFDSKTLPLEAIPIDEEYLESFDLPATADPLASSPEPALSVGAAGNEVMNLQSRLYDLGYFTHEINGLFNERTRDAVIEFQQTNGLNADGVVDSGTNAVLHSSRAKPKDPSYTENEEYEYVFDHYEEVEVQRSRQVYDHDEYTMRDKGDGTYEEVSHPVYRTEYYTEIEQRPVYKLVLKEKGE